MNKNTFSNISMNGRMAYAILCVEQYLCSKFPDDDWSILSREMWKVTSLYWDEWNERFIEIIPQYLFEFDTYENSDFEKISKEDYFAFVELFKNKPDTINQLLLKLQDLYDVYIYSDIPGEGEEASQIVLDICNILDQNNVSLPNVESVSFSSFSEKNGWGNSFNGESLSLILSADHH